MERTTSGVSTENWQRMMAAGAVLGQAQAILRLLQSPPERPRLALGPDEAAAAIGVSRDFFDEHVMPELRVIRRGRRRLVPVRELERWLEESAARALDES